MIERGRIEALTEYTLRTLAVHCVGWCRAAGHRPLGCISNPRDSLSEALGCVHGFTLQNPREVMRVTRAGRMCRNRARCA